MYISNKQFSVKNVIFLLGHAKWFRHGIKSQEKDRACMERDHSDLPVQSQKFLTISLIKKRNYQHKFFKSIFHWTHNFESTVIQRWFNSWRWIDIESMLIQYGVPARLIIKFIYLSLHASLSTSHFISRTLYEYFNFKDLLYTSGPLS